MKQKPENKKLIFYGICGEGFGHLSRAEAIIPFLKESGYDVHIFTSGNVLKRVREIFPECPSFEIRGLNFIYENNSIDLFRTSLKWLQIFYWWTPEACKAIYRIFKYKPAAVITDYEPILAQTALYTGTKLVTLDHQQVFSECRTDDFYHKPHIYFLARIFNALINSIPDFRIIISFFHPPLKVKEGKFSHKHLLAGPLIRREVLKTEPSNGDHILIYQTSETLGWLDRVIKDLPGEKWIYGGGIEADENIKIKEFNRENFIADLASCRFAIVNGGHSTICEALYLGKPIICLPVLNQIEQEMNAHYLEKMSFGKSYLLQQNQIPDFSEFLQNVEHYRENVLQNRIEPGNQIVRKKLLDVLKGNKRFHYIDRKKISKEQTCTNRGKFESWDPNHSALVLDLDGTLHQGRWKSAKGMTNIDIAYQIGWQNRVLGLPIPPPFFSLKILTFLIRERRWKKKWGDGPRYYDKLINTFRSFILGDVPYYEFQKALESVTQYAHPDLAESMNRLSGHFNRGLISSKSFEPVLIEYQKYLSNHFEHPIDQIGNSLEPGQSSIYITGEDKAKGIRNWQIEHEIKHCLVVGDTMQDLAMGDVAKDFLGEQNAIMVALNPKSVDFANATDLTFMDWESLADYFTK